MTEDECRTRRSEGRHGTLSEKAQKLLWARAAGRCQFDGCNDDLTLHLIAGSRKANKGYVAHIIGSSASGPRGEAARSKELAKDPDNAILLCDACHREIDKEHPEKYNEETLRRMKLDHEAWIRRAVALRADSQSHILRFTNKVGSNETAVPLDECIAAMRGIAKTPASLDVIDLKLGLPAHEDADDVFWAVEGNDLQVFYNRRIEGNFNTGKYRHLSVFGFGPMPLLVKLGQLLSDFHDIDVFARHREPVPSWTWRDEPPQFRPVLKEGAPGASRVALKVSLTDNISDERVTIAVGPENISIWELTCEAPGFAAISTREDLSQFRKLVRRTFNRIKEVHGEQCEVLVFPAAPAACCIEFGRVWQPKAHRPMKIFDQSKDSGFLPRVVIE